MTTTRTPVHRPHKSRITPEAVVLFLRYQELWPTYLDCIRGNCTQPHEIGFHCSVCRECIDTGSKFDQLLGVRPWETSPLDTFEAEPPSHYRNDQLPGWRAAWKVRQQIEAASAKR